MFCFENSSSSSFQAIFFLAFFWKSQNFIYTGREPSFVHIWIFARAIKTYLGFDDTYISINNINISTDKIASLLDCEKIFKTFDKTKINKILEIGAGSCRTSEALLSISEKTKYTSEVLSSKNQNKKIIEKNNRSKHKVEIPSKKPKNTSKEFRRDLEN